MCDSTLLRIEELYPLHHAIRIGDIDRALALVQLQIHFEICDFNDHPFYDITDCWYGHTPLYLAAYYGRLEIARALVDAGADVYGHGPVDDPNDDVEVPMFAACREGHAEIVRYFLEIGFNPNFANGVTHEAAISTSTTPEIIQLLSDFGADIDHPNCITGQTAFHYAALCGRLDLMQALFRLGADIHASTYNNTNALYWSAQIGCTEGVRWLLNRRVSALVISVDARDSVLHRVARYCRNDRAVDIARLILGEFGTSEMLDYRDIDEKTAMDYALARGHRELVACFAVHMFRHNM